MPVTIIRPGDKPAPKKKVRKTHATPLPVNLDLNQPGRLRVGHLLTLLSVSHGTLYKKIKAGTYPPPDDRDGGRPYWKTETIRELLRH